MRPGIVHLSRGLLALGLAALCVWCGWLSGFHRSTTPARLTWAISLAVVVLVNLLFLAKLVVIEGPAIKSNPAQARDRPVLRIAPWIALATVILLWEVLGIDTSTHEPHLTLSALIEVYRLLKAAVLLVWMLIGIGFGVVLASRPPSTDNETGTLGSASLFGLGAGGKSPALLLPASRPVGLVFWVTVILIAAAIEAIARISDGPVATGGEMIQLAGATRSGRMVMIVAWAYAGFHLFVH